MVMKPSLWYSEPIDGFTVDSEQLSNDLSDAWLGTGAAGGSREAVAPTVSQQQWDTFVEDTAQPLVADAYTVTADVRPRS